MKLASSLTLIFLIPNIFSNASHPSNDNSHGRRVSRTMVDQERELQIIPTLLQKIMELRRKFDNKFDGVIGDILFGMAPSDSPSMAPSEIPSATPSDYPSGSPSVVPSAAPFSLNDVLLRNQSNDYETCQSDQKDVSSTSTAELIILYSYKLELKQEAHVFKTLEKIEDQLQTHLIDHVCGGTSIISVSSGPADIPGATCLMKPDTGIDGPCYVIAGRYKLLIGQDSIGDANSIYCEYLEATRSFMSTDNITAIISDVVSISSTLSDSLIPSFCTYQSSEVSASVSDDEKKSSGGTASAKLIVPIVVGSVALFVALAAFIFVSLYRREAPTEVEMNNRTDAYSDLEFNNSDETESQISYTDPNTTTKIQQQTNTAKPGQQNCIDIIQQPQQSKVASGDFKGLNDLPFSPTNTEQEIIFSPSSSLATSVLFRSP